MSQKLKAVKCSLMMTPVVTIRYVLLVILVTLKAKFSSAVTLFTFKNSIFKRFINNLCYINIYIYCLCVFISIQNFLEFIYNNFLVLVFDYRLRFFIDGIK